MTSCGPFLEKERTRDLWICASGFEKPYRTGVKIQARNGPVQSMQTCGVQTPRFPPCGDTSPRHRKRASVPPTHPGQWRVTLVTAGLLARGSQPAFRLPGFPVASWNTASRSQLRGQPGIGPNHMCESLTLFPFSSPKGTVTAAMLPAPYRFRNGGYPSKWNGLFAGARRGRGRGRFGR